MRTLYMIRVASKGGNTCKTISAEKWLSMALSRPYFQYNQPNPTPNSPFKTMARVTTRKSIGKPMAFVVGKCPNPNSTAARMLATQKMPTGNF